MSEAFRVRMVYSLEHLLEESSANMLVKCFKRNEVEQLTPIHKLKRHVSNLLTRLARVLPLRILLKSMKFHNVSVVKLRVSFDFSFNRF